jgi:exopolyphosphatase / guanosine-5'-triphosphate,3'-diphosphate pyrophosphatase
MSKNMSSLPAGANPATLQGYSPSGFKSASKRNVPKKSYEFAAAIDLGSNSFHMIVARIQNGQPVIIDRIREMVRLADGMDHDGNILAEPKKRALECLKRFGQRLADFPEGSVRVVGTNTLRSATNADEFLAEAERALGHPIDIISGVEEARLIYIGVAHSLAAFEQQRLVMDIGGSSTELIIGTGHDPRYMESLEMGCVSVTQDYFRDGSITPRKIERARIFAHTELKPHASTFRRYGWQEAIGTSGTIRAVKKVITTAGWTNGKITLEALRRLLNVIGEKGLVANIKLEGLSAERAPVFIGGVIILAATFEALEIQSMAVSDGALREGLLYDLVGRIQDEDIRGRSVTHLAQRYHADAVQARLVGQTSLHALRQVADAWGLDQEESERWLNWAAQLHEIGLDIAHSRHHHHAAYIIEHSDLAGFSQQEQLLLAALVRSHRRKLPLKLYKELPKRIGKLAPKLSVLLRLGVILNRNRGTTAFCDFTMQVQDKRIKLKFPAGWMKQQPLTSADLEVESEYLSAAGFTVEVG